MIRILSILLFGFILLSGCQNQANRSFSNYSPPMFTVSVPDPLKLIKKKSLGENLDRIYKNRRKLSDVTRELIDRSKTLSDVELCDAATFSQRWATNSIFVNEAKNRNLSLEFCLVKKLQKFSDFIICKYATDTYSNISHYSSSSIKNNWSQMINSQKYVIEAKRRGLDCNVDRNNKPVIASKSKNTKKTISSAELEKERAQRLEEERKRKALEKRIAELEKKNKELQQPKKQQKAKPKSSSGSGFFISKLGHIITNQHVVNKCKKITIGDHIDKQVPAKLLETDSVNDLALLRTTNIKMASAETQSLLRKLSIEIVPLASGGLMRKGEVKGGEDVIVAGFPYGVRFGTDIKVTFGNVNSTKGIGDDSTQFQIQAPVQPGNSGGPIYDRYGNIVGVVVSQLNKFKLAKSIGSLPENVNFGIKASTVRQFLNTSGVITNYSKRTKPVSNEKMFELASKQTVMVVWHR